MKKKFFLLSTIVLMAMSAALLSCDKKDEPQNQDGPGIADNDPTKFSKSSIVGIWACVGSNHQTYDFLTGEYTYNWDYDKDASTYKVYWYFNIQSDSKVQYINVIDRKDDELEDHGEYRKSDGYLHLDPNTKWSPLVDATYVFEEKEQVIRCTSGEALGFKVETVVTLLGSDTIFRVERYGQDEAAIYDKTDWIQDQYVIRVKGIKKDLKLQ